MKLMIVDDHPVLRNGFAALLKSAGPDTEVLQAQDVMQALSLIAQHQDLDVVVLDLLMPGVGGLTAISQISRFRQDLPIVVLSSSEDPQDVRKALSLGALGYVPKSASSHSLLSAIKLVMNGDLYVPPLILREQGVAVRAVPDTIGSAASVLSSRQIDVLRLIAIGEPNKAIAHKLDLSEKTVKAHITAIFKALNVINRTQAAAAGRAQKLF